VYGWLVQKLPLDGNFNRNLKPFGLRGAAFAHTPLALPFGMGKKGRLQVPPCRRSFGRRSPVVNKGKQRGLHGLRRRPHLFAAQFENVAPEVALSINQDSAQGHSVCLRLVRLVIPRATVGVVGVAE
jgi:hypothetical protein